MGTISKNVASTDNQQERVPKDVENLNYYLAGFVDGEGCFTISIRKHPTKTRFGWTIDPFFQVYQHKDNSRILFLFKMVTTVSTLSIAPFIVVPIFRFKIAGTFIFF